ncbi:MAG: hypothetical protein PHQ40_15290 [Anaerolineaceae bacterium]|nr:hypothetical protein [Anaerolineaceae bacterium]
MADPTITVRHALHSDADLLAQIGRQTFSDSFTADNTPENIVAYRDADFSLGPAKPGPTGPALTPHQ